MRLPLEFTERMRRILGTEYAAFEKSYEQPRKYGLRVNTAKIEPEEFERIAPFHLTPIPWVPGGYFYEEQDAPARHPFYYGGLYYLQEPSAMTPAVILEAEPGERLLDLCAAPGGKATALGARLRGQGILVANDISASRCRALLKNLEVFGIPNALVTNGVPARLQEQFPEYFDRVLLDAPCSGEGMFRKDEGALRAWYPERPQECAKIQRDLILRAADMLRPGGRLLYSTCTFAPEENEEVIRYLLEQREDMELLEIPRLPGREGFAPGLLGLERCVRLWPHRLDGEGHFLALLGKRGGDGYENPGESENPEEIRVRNLQETGAERLEEKKGRSPEGILWERQGEQGEGNSWEISGGRLKRDQRGNRKEELEEGRRRNRREELEEGRQKSRKGTPDRKGGRKGKNKNSTAVQGGPGKEERAALEEFFGAVLKNPREHQPCGKLELHGGQVYWEPSDLPAAEGIPFLRRGLYLGEVKKGRFEPSQSLAMALSPKECAALCRLSPEDERVIRYLRGETVEIGKEESARESGWVLVCAGDCALGWGKLVKGLLKNKYHAGWRMK